MSRLQGEAGSFETTPSAVRPMIVVRRGDSRQINARLGGADLPEIEFLHLVSQRVAGD